MAAVKRVQKLLKEAEKRETQSAVAQTRKSKKRKFGASNNDSNGEIGQAAALLAQEKLRKQDNHDEGEVVMKGTGKAIDKTLQLGLWFQQRDEYGVFIKTASVGAIDDIVPKDGEPVSVDQADSLEDAPPMEEADEDVPEARLRYTSVVEVWVTQR